MKPKFLIQSVMLLILLPLLQGCEEEDPQCEGSWYFPVDLSSPPPMGTDILENLKWHYKNKSWFFYFEYKTDAACGHSSIDLIYTFQYFSESANRSYFFTPYLEINGDVVSTTYKRDVSVSAIGMKDNLRGGFFNMFRLGTPYFFNIRCGVELDSQTSLTEDEAKALARQYLGNMKVRFDYLRLAQ